MSLVYLSALLVSLGAVLLLDHRWKLVLWADPRRAAIVLGSGIALFLAWDAAGILTGAFERGESAIMTGIEVAPELPVEEIVFVTFLCHLTLVLFTLVRRAATGGEDS